MTNCGKRCENITGLLSLQAEHAPVNGRCTLCDLFRSLLDSRLNSDSERKAQKDSWQNSDEENLQNSGRFYQR